MAECRRTEREREPNYWPPGAKWAALTGGRLDAAGVWDLKDAKVSSGVHELLGQAATEPCPA
jgi:hypothetical protein